MSEKNNNDLFTMPLENHGDRITSLLQYELLSNVQTLVISIYGTDLV